MLWLKRHIGKIAILSAGMPLLMLMTLVVVSVADAHEGVLRASTPTPTTVQATPTVDATMTVLNKEKLQLDITQEKQGIAQQEHTFNNFIWTGGAALLSAIGGFVIAYATFFYNSTKERREREDAQEKGAEERFQKAVTDLGSERKEARIAAAIILLTFLQPGYEQFYRQVFDLAVAYLQPLGGDTLTSGFVPLDPLRQALITVFKESFKRVRGEWKEQKPRSLTSDSGDYDRLGGVGIQLDQAYLVKADLRGVWMREASLRKAHIYQARFTGAHLKGADFTDAYMEDAQLNKTDLTRANFTRTKLLKANFTEAYVARANFTEADLTGANPETANSLKDAKMSGVIGLTKEQKDACKAKGAIVDEDTTISPPASPATPAPPAQQPS